MCMNERYSGWYNKCVCFKKNDNNNNKDDNGGENLKTMKTMIK